MMDLNTLYDLKIQQKMLKAREKLGWLNDYTILKLHSDFKREDLQMGVHCHTECICIF
jgi:hypothetical protein